MARPLHFHKPTNTELRQLLHGLETIIDPVIRQRIEVIVTLCYTPIATEVAQLFNLHLNTVLDYVRQFNRYRLAGITAHRKGGRSPSIPRRIQQRIVAMAQRPPSDFGLPDGTWSLSRLRWFVTKKRKLLRRISREHIRRILKKTESTCGASSASSRTRTHAAGLF